jgi:hypothetical protein
MEAFTIKKNRQNGIEGAVFTSSVDSRGRTVNTPFLLNAAGYVLADFAVRNAAGEKVIEKYDITITSGMAHKVQFSLTPAECDIEAGNSYMAELAVKKVDESDPQTVNIVPCVVLDTIIEYPEPEG